VLEDDTKVEFSVDVDEESEVGDVLVGENGEVDDESVVKEDEGEDEEGNEELLSVDVAFSDTDVELLVLEPENETDDDDRPVVSFCVCRIPRYLDCS